MDKTILISLQIEDLQSVITGCVNSCLSNHNSVTPQTALSLDKLFSAHQAADFLNLSVSAIYGLVHRKQIPASKRGKRLYFSKQQLLDWVKDGHRLTQKEIDSAAEKHLENIKKRRNKS